LSGQGVGGSIMREGGREPGRCAFRDLRAAHQVRPTQDHSVRVRVQADQFLLRIVVAHGHRHGESQTRDHVLLTVEHLDQVDPQCNEGARCMSGLFGSPARYSRPLRPCPLQWWHWSLARNLDLQATTAILNDQRLGPGWNGLRGHRKHRFGRRGNCGRGALWGFGGMK
jgi:hypothetical protein